MDNHQRQQQYHPVIDTLEKTRQEHHEEPFPHSPPENRPSVTRTPSGRLLGRTGADVVDQVVQQAEAIHLSDPASDSASDSINNKNRSDHKTGSSHYPLSSSPSSSPCWMSLASKSTNQLPSKTIVDQMGGPNTGTAAELHHENHHDKPSVLPEILPGFMGRMADIHHASFKSVDDHNDNGSSGQAHHSTDDNSNNHGSNDHSNHKAEGKWTGGTMFPTMTGPKNPFSNNHNSANDNHHQGKANRHRCQSPTEEANRRLAKNSILYESSDLPESTTKLTDEDNSDLVAAHNPPHHSYHPYRRRSSDFVTGSSGPSTASPPVSKTLVQGGQGGRRWSHELSPEKAGLVGSVVEAAGLIKDVILDKIQQRPPSAGSQRQHQHPIHGDLSTDEKLAAAKIAFGGAEEAGDQNIFLEGLSEHLRHEQAQKAALAEAEAVAEAAASDPTSSKSSSTIPTMTTRTTTEDILGAAPDMANKHKKSIFHMAANPETRKSLIFEHPESLGYHARDVNNLPPIEESSKLHYLTSNKAVGGQQDLSKSSR
ncbi:hypothetical protein BX616_000083 [Lobosporangium transversale]|uniref:Uncharacterized protein n=1 Tax=Lobosporangium transversale TaxID=64571 RepID=A0A1Y2H1M4_9FUNG|nr:hypothetical protein BCR41DRAFT_345361 [Lobosporangium transversale]KAF9908600.1 hypothetical protein BX616_000083 [Lobosporangium transversale]ORZ28457.1 hypothetical protein BCR41DRAFT_345361 [Lobosporangium transversale]|eukprot:XP_021886142.1 hypothetical protein BCR41DRAFT_345361 [Lobosporangium transversale]